MKITKVYASEILDSRGVPTVSCFLELDNGSRVQASVPSGASTGKHEALELRDGDATRYLGRGVRSAVEHVNTNIANILVGQEPDLLQLDKEIIALDGTENKSNLGANATLAASIAIARAQALCSNQELYVMLAGLSGNQQVTMPRMLFNLINGGAHAGNNLSFQEFMVMPTSEKPLALILEEVFLIYYSLRQLLQSAGLGTCIGDEGGFAPVLASEQAALDLLLQAIERAGFSQDEYVFGIDVAASHFYNEDTQLYTVHGKSYDADALIDFYEDLCTSYPVFSIEDGLAQDDVVGFAKLTARLGKRVQIAGDDLFVTNEKRIQRGIDGGFANACIIKPNQVGTVSEAMAALRLCNDNGVRAIASHRSGETNDSFIADFAVGLHAGQFKGGAIVHGERVAKYNRLLEIERLLARF